MFDPIVVELRVPVPPDRARAAFTDAGAVTRGNFASPDWCCPSARVDPRKGSRHVARIEAKDGATWFDVESTVEAVASLSALNLRLADGRLSRTTFAPDEYGTRVRTVFDADAARSIETKRDGWQALLGNHATHVAQQERDRWN